MQILLAFLATFLALSAWWFFTALLMRAARRLPRCLFCRTNPPIAGTDLCERCLADRLP